jgi:hypothetical protein
VHVDLAELLHHGYRFLLVYLQQGPFATGAGAGAAELDGLGIEHPYLVLVVEAVEDLFRVQTEQLFVLDGGGELDQVVEIFAVILALGRQLLQQDARRTGSPSWWPVRIQRRVASCSDWAK